MTWQKEYLLTAVLGKEYTLATRKLKYCVLEVLTQVDSVRPAAHLVADGKHNKLPVIQC